MKKKDQPFSSGRSAAAWYSLTAIVSIILILVISLMVWNTAELKKALTKSAEEYVTDVSDQLTDDITARVEAFELALTLLADHIPDLRDDSGISDFLEEQTGLLGFDELALIKRDGSAVPEGFRMDNPRDLSGIRESFLGESSVIYVEGQSLLFSVPVYQDGQIEMTLVGVRGKENMQSLIQPKSYSGNGLSCIVNSGGTVIISPTDLKPFLQLNDIFLYGTDQEAIRDIERMENNLAAGRSGVFEFTAVDKNRLVMSYHPLGINDWFLLTLVPADLISGEANAYIVRSFIYVGVIIVLFSLLILALLRFFRTNRSRLEAIAFGDPLTGGLNEAGFQMAYQKLTSKGIEPLTYAVVYLNVKDFKLINENFGVPAADDTLRYIYRVLKKHVHEGELVARGNADQFLLCLKESGKEAIRTRLEEMISDINSFAQNTDLPYYLTILQGAYLIDEPELNITIIADRARAACKLGTDKDACAFYNSDIMRRLKQEQELNALFAASIENHDFQVYLQPKVRLADGRLTGAEALVRWIHPRRGMIYPSDFIPLFEKSDHICRLDLYVFEKVCAMLKGWREEGRELLTISVNLSRRHFKNLNFLRPFSALKEKYGIPDGVIEIELTESTFFDERQRELVPGMLGEMHRRGFLCSLDDFGVGFSSLALLKEFDVDAIKLDRQFFKDIANEKAQNIIASFIELAEKLNIHTVAEGIETQEQIDFLRKARCGMVQGYYFSKPLPVGEFERWSACRD